MSVDACRSRGGVLKPRPGYIVLIIGMFDTVNFRLTAADVEGVSFLEQTLCYLADAGVHQYNSGGVIVTGNLNGLKVTVSRWQVKINGGSLCNWFLGNNYQSLTRRDVQRAIERLSDELHLPMSRAAVTRLDVGCTIITKHPTGVYFNHLGELAGAKRLPHPGGVYYDKRGVVLCFYDKNRERRDKRGAIPDLYRGRNVLRYEQRFTQRLASAFKLAEVTGATLYDERFYIEALKRWRDTYNAIDKINDIQLNFGAMKGKRELNKRLFLALIEQFGGEVAFLNEITEAQKRGEIDRKQASDLRKAVKQACQVQEGLIIKSEVVSELSKKIAEAVRFYR